MKKTDKSLTVYSYDPEEAHRAPKLDEPVLVDLKELKKLVPNIEVNHFVLAVDNGHTLYYRTENEIAELLKNDDFLKGLPMVWDRGLSNYIKMKVVLTPVIPVVEQLLKEKNRK
jgi:hypothetical protein